MSRVAVMEVTEGNKKDCLEAVGATELIACSL